MCMTTDAMLEYYMGADDKRLALITLSDINSKHVPDIIKVLECLVPEGELDELHKWEDVFTGKQVADLLAEKQQKMTRESCLTAAKRCVCGDREQDYGSPEDCFQVIANLWVDYLQGRDILVDTIEPYDVAAMMCLLKIARIAGGCGKQDNWVDLAGYAACGGELGGNADA